MDPYVGEIRLFAGNFAPRGWAFCMGQLLAISQNTALFSLLGNNFGGDGVTTFALPDLQGRVPMHRGQGPGLSPRTIGEAGGSTSVTLIESEMPRHAHPASTVPATTNLASGNVPATGGRYAATTPPFVSAPHDNQTPFLGISFIIALQGVFPPRP